MIGKGYGIGSTDFGSGGPAVANSDLNDHIF